MSHLPTTMKGTTMQITHEGNLDLSLEAYVLGIPAGMKFPASMRTLVKTYDDALLEYDSAVIEAENSRQALAEAGEKDKAALLASFDRGEADPGTAHQATALRAAVVADERVRQIAGKVTLAAQKVVDAVAAHRVDLLTNTLRSERTLIATVAAKWQQLATLLGEIEAVDRSVGTHTNWLLHQLGDRTRIEAPEMLQSWLPPASNRNREDALATIAKIETALLGHSAEQPRAAE